MFSIHLFEHIDYDSTTLFCLFLLAHVRDAHAQSDSISASACGHFTQDLRSIGQNREISGYLSTILLFKLDYHVKLTLYWWILWIFTLRHIATKIRNICAEYCER